MAKYEQEQLEMETQPAADASKAAFFPKTLPAEQLSGHGQSGDGKSRQRPSARQSPTAKRAAATAQCSVKTNTCCPGFRRKKGIYDAAREHRYGNHRTRRLLRGGAGQAHPDHHPGGARDIFAEQIHGIRGCHQQRAFPLIPCAGMKWIFRTPRSSNPSRRLRHQDGAAAGGFWRVGNRSGGPERARKLLRNLTDRSRECPGDAAASSALFSMAAIFILFDGVSLRPGARFLEPSAGRAAAYWRAGRLHRVQCAGESGRARDWERGNVWT